MNPLVAVFLCWLVLGEPIGPCVLLGTLIMVPAVILAVPSLRRATLRVR